jgi:hypothetical protein
MVSVIIWRPARHAFSAVASRSPRCAPMDRSCRWSSRSVAGMRKGGRSPSGGLRRVQTTHRDPAKVELAAEMSRLYPPNPKAPGGVHHVVATGKSELVPVIREDLLVRSAGDSEQLRMIRELRLHSCIVVPLHPGRCRRRHQLHHRRISPRVRRARSRDRRGLGTAGRSGNRQRPSLRSRHRGERPTPRKPMRRRANSSPR